MTYPSAKELTENALQSAIDEGLEKLTDDQRAFFNRLYPDGPKPGQLAVAYDQIQRTRIKNGEELS